MGELNLELGFVWASAGLVLEFVLVEGRRSFVQEVYVEERIHWKIAVAVCKGGV